MPIVAETDGTEKDGSKETHYHRAFRELTKSCNFIAESIASLN